MTLRPQGYRPRLLDTMVRSCLSEFGAVSIEGPKYCGKTWTGLSHAQHAVYVDDPAGGFANRQLALQNPAKLLLGNEPILLDEWQVAPGIWDAVRHEVDRGTHKGRYILTGSSTPFPNAPQHSGAGRIARLALRPMTLFESGESSGEVSLADVLNSNRIDECVSTTALEQVAFFCVRGGWPESIDAAESAQLRLPTQYLESVYTSDMSAVENSRRDPSKAEKLLRSLAGNNATTATNTALKWDVTDGLGSISAPTISAYLSALRRMFILEESPGWAPQVRSKTRMRSASKRWLVDPSLACAALGLSTGRILSDMPTFGSVFEGMCLRDLGVYASLLDARLYHYHDNSGLEVDAIIENRDGRYGAVEVKLNSSQVDAAAANLKRFEAKMQRNGVPAPSCLLVVTSAGVAKTRSDGVSVSPITCLKP